MERDKRGRFFTPQMIIGAENSMWNSPLVTGNSHLYHHLLPGAHQWQSGIRSKAWTRIQTLRERENLPLAGLSSKCSQQAGVGQAKAGSQNLTQVSPMCDNKLRASATVTPLFLDYMLAGTGMGSKVGAETVVATSTGAHIPDIKYFLCLAGARDALRCSEHGWACFSVIRVTSGESLCLLFYAFIINCKSAGHPESPHGKLQRETPRCNIPQPPLWNNALYYLPSLPRACSLLLIS